MLLSASVIISATNAQKTFSDPNAEVRNVGSFTSISVSNAFEVHIVQDTKDAVAVSASTDEYRSRIQTKVENGRLIIRMDDDKKFWRGLSGDKLKLKAYISVRNLEKLSVSGACKVEMEGGIKGENLAIDVSGASDVSGKVTVKKLVVDISGASDVTLEGSTSDLKVDLSGASDFKAYELSADYCVASLSGACSATFTVNKEMAVDASGASSVKYKGSGMLRDIRTTGASSVKKT